MTPQQRQQILDAVAEWLNDPDLTITWENSIKRITEPGDAWERYAPGRGRRITLTIPCDPGDAYEIP